MVGILLIAAAALFAVGAWKARPTPPLMFGLAGLLLLTAALFVALVVPGVHVDF